MDLRERARSAAALQKGLRNLDKARTSGLSGVRFADTVVEVVKEVLMDAGHPVGGEAIIRDTFVKNGTWVAGEAMAIAASCVGPDACLSAALAVRGKGDKAPALLGGLSFLLERIGSGFDDGYSKIALSGIWGQGLYKIPVGDSPESSCMVVPGDNLYVAAVNASGKTKWPRIDGVPGDGRTPPLSAAILTGVDIQSTETFLAERMCVNHQRPAFGLVSSSAVHRIVLANSGLMDKNDRDTMFWHFPFCDTYREDGCTCSCCLFLLPTGADGMPVAGLVGDRTAHAALVLACAEIDRDISPAGRSRKRTGSVVRSAFGPWPAVLAALGAMFPEGANDATWDFSDVENVFREFAGKPGIRETGEKVVSGSCPAATAFLSGFMAGGRTASEPPAAPTVTLDLPDPASMAVTPLSGAEGIRVHAAHVGVAVVTRELLMGGETPGVPLDGTVPGDMPPVVVVVDETLPDYAACADGLVQAQWRGRMACRHEAFPKLLPGDTVWFAGPLYEG